MAVAAAARAPIDGPARPPGGLINTDLRPHLLPWPLSAGDLSSLGRGVGMAGLPGRPGPRPVRPGPRRLASDYYDPEIHSEQELGGWWGGGCLVAPLPRTIGERTRMEAALSTPLPYLSLVRSNT